MQVLLCGFNKFMSRAIQTLSHWVTMHWSNDVTVFAHAVYAHFQCCSPIESVKSTVKCYKRWLRGLGEELWVANNRKEALRVEDPSVVEDGVVGGTSQCEDSVLAAAVPFKAMEDASGAVSCAAIVISFGVHLMPNLDSGEENLLCKFTFTCILTTCCSNTMRRLALKDLQPTFLLVCTCFAATVFMSYMMASPPMAEKDEYAMTRCLGEQTLYLGAPQFTPSCRVLQLNPLLLMAEILTEKAKSLYNSILQSVTFPQRLSPDLGRYWNADHSCRAIIIVPFL
jgi:hypothetical protein